MAAARGLPAFERLGLGLDQLAEGAREIRHAEEIAFLRHLSARQEHGGAARNLGEVVTGAADRRHQVRVDRHAALCVANRRGQHVGDGPGAEALQRGEQPADIARDDAGLDAAIEELGRHLGGLDAHRRRPRHAERQHLAALLVVHRHEAVAAEPGALRLDQVQRRRHRDGGVKGVAALHQHLHARHRRQRMGGGDQGAAAGHRRPMRTQAGARIVVGRELAALLGHGLCTAHQEHHQERSGEPEPGRGGDGHGRSIAQSGDGESWVLSLGS